MGFLVSFTRQMYLTNYINNLERRITDITTQKIELTETISNLTTQISDIGNNDSPAVKSLKARLADLENYDRELDMRMKKYQAQLQAAQAELQSAEQSLQGNIQKSFSYSLGG